MPDTFIGRRKTATARAQLEPGSGEFELNGRDLEEYFPTATLQHRVTEPFDVVLGRRGRTGGDGEGGETVHSTGEGSASSDADGDGADGDDADEQPEIRWDVNANLDGGGTTGQADALRLAIARALVAEDESWRKPLKDAGMLTRDSRAVERKKPGRKKARKSPQFSKR